ncbi:hypothetical protein ANAPC2_01452 [Anaplasma phagocytophilum]|nr:hypothetical protein ANAPC2_01452 [Anaplasma phagocytophilum]
MADKTADFQVQTIFEGGVGVCIIINLRVVSPSHLENIFEDLLSINERFKYWVRLINLREIITQA